MEEHPTDSARSTWPHMTSWLEGQETETALVLSELGYMLQVSRGAFLSFTQSMTTDEMGEFVAELSRVCGRAVETEPRLWGMGTFRRHQGHPELSRYEGPSSTALLSLLARAAGELVEQRVCDSGEESEDESHSDSSDADLLALCREAKACLGCDAPLSATVENGCVFWESTVWVCSGTTLWTGSRCPLPHSVLCAACGSAERVCGSCAAYMMVECRSDLFFDPVERSWAKAKDHKNIAVTAPQTQVEMLCYAAAAATAVNLVNGSTLSQYDFMHSFLTSDQCTWSERRQYITGYLAAGKDLSRMSRTHARIFGLATQQIGAPIFPGNVTVTHLTSLTVDQVLRGLDEDAVFMMPKDSHWFVVLGYRVLTDGTQIIHYWNPYGSYGFTSRFDYWDAGQYIKIS
ncbi:hypothetical protein [Streptomyces sp. NPDC059918]|uniref:hypothetical protein n=1 Tax=unclassified Streptomyces TaxID=2593676 RepID=UPI003658615F